MEISGTNPSADLDIVRPDRFKSSQNTSPNGSPKLQNSHLPFDLTKTSLSHHKFSIPLSSQPGRGLLKRYRRTKRDNQNLSLDPAVLDRNESKRLDGRGKDMYNQYRAKREKFIKIKENIYQEPHVNSDQTQKGHFQAVKLKHSEICYNTRYSNEKYGDSSFAAYNFRSVLP